MAKRNTQNIQIGVDLGTTNSEIAINNDDNIEIIKNVFGDEYTPSVFGIDKAKNKVVGKRAYERLYKDASDEEFANNKAEIKRLMGTSEKVHFARIDQDLTPEEISAEIVKSLKEDILRKYPDFETRAVVITTPAYFSTLQAEATKRAGNLAGFDYVVLLQEPIAAAISYGFMSSKNENWIIYDLGGGTFDVALISSKDGALSVLSHSGDNFLGGKDFDWLVVDKIIVPAILEKHEIKDFNRGNPKYRSIFAKLKYIAENAKVYLSQYEKTVLEVENIGDDDASNEIYVTVDLTRKGFEQLVKPLVDRTIELTKETIQESGVNQSTIHRVILVGGPTQIPYIKDRLNQEFKITVDSSVDPLTVVARGACIFAISQRIPKEFLNKEKKVDRSVKTLTLNYESLTSEEEETVSGVIEELKDSDDEYYVQIQGESGFYSGSKAKLKGGKFFDTVVLEPRKTNLFWVYLFDKDGNSVQVDPDSFAITHGLSVTGAPIPHSIGVAVAKRDMSSGFALTEMFEPFFEKNSILPLRMVKTYKTVKRLKKGDTENALPIKVYEGESETLDRNHLICDLKITGENLPYDLPDGTEVEIKIEVNESREVTVEAFIPTIDLSLNARATIYAEDIDVEQMESDLNAQRERIKTIEANCTPEEKSKLENTVQSVNTSIGNAHIDQDEKRKAHKQLKDLKVKLDQIEKAKALPQLTKEFNESIADIQKVIETLGDEKEKEMNNDQIKTLKEEGERAIERKDKYLLMRVNEQVKELGMRVALANPAMWAYQFEKLTTENHTFLSEKEASYYISKGKRAMDLGDVDELKRCVHSLMLLLPPEEQEAIRGNLSGITH
ncbi:Hsp70 family protein [Patescibacteria group bacterium AH-259-L07]|nr:Hsp70 family protein [Patescibacteria group bacterium AH-259-L07]